MMTMTMMKMKNLRTFSGYGCILISFGIIEEATSSLLTDHIANGVIIGPISITYIKNNHFSQQENNKNI